MNLSTLDFRVMKRFLLYIGGLLSIVLVAVWLGEVLNRWLVFSSSNSSGYRMKRLFEFDSSKGEMPILGSSRAEGNFAPKNISPIAFNYGLRGSHFHETLFQLKVVLSRPQGGVVLVNLDPWGMDDGSYMHDYRFVFGRTDHDPLFSCGWGVVFCRDGAFTANRSKRRPRDQRGGRDPA